MQIAIEWVNDNYPKFNHHEIEEKLTELRDTVEKEQIEGTYLTGYSERCREIMGEETFAKSSTDYYNKKYKP